MSAALRVIYEPVARQAAAANGVDGDVFVAQIQEESGFDHISDCNAFGACGIAQIIPAFHPGVDVFDPVASLWFAAALDASYLIRYGGNYCAMLAAYNAGPGNVDEYGLDVVLSPAFAGGQTLRYVTDILGSITNCYIPPPPPPPPPPSPVSEPSPLLFALGAGIAGAGGYLLYRKLRGAP